MKHKFNRQERAAHAFGDHRNEWAVKHRKPVVNFSQSRDLRENRSIRQSKLARRRTPVHGR